MQKSLWTLFVVVFFSAPVMANEAISQLLGKWITPTLHVGDHTDGEDLIISGEAIYLKDRMIFAMTCRMGEVRVVARASVPISIDSHFITIKGNANVERRKDGVTCLSHLSTGVQGYSISRDGKIMKIRIDGQDFVYQRS